MRDHPNVPNVFRVASTHSINSMGVLATPGSNSNQQQQQQQQLARHQLTTSASIEHYQQQQQQQHSPYATLPRGCQRRTPQQLLQQQQQQQQNTGVINTISGSIPATGFNDVHLNNLQHSNNKNNNNNNNNSNNNCNDRQQLQSALKTYKPQQQQQHPQRTVTITTPTKSSTGAAAAAIVADNQPDVESNSNNSNRANVSNISFSVKAGYLWLLTPVAASISVAIVIAALAGPQWLYTEEKLPNANYNGTANFNALDDGAYITKYTKSSLWIFCTTMPGLDIDTYNCIKIDYFPQEGYQPDPHDSTSAIPYTVTKSCPIFLFAGVFLLISFIIFLIPTCSHRNSLYYFSSGILFIVSGLIMLIGLIAYISILKAEIGSKLRPRSTLQPALFKVTYGQSFFLFVFGFIATEFVGVLNIFLYIHLQEFSYYSRLPCFNVTNIHAKIKEEQPKSILSDSYKRYKQPGTVAISASEDSLSQALQEQQQHQQQHQQQQQQQQRQQHQPQLHQQLALRASNVRLHQVHDATGRIVPCQTQTQTHAQTLPAGFACRKHPNANANANSGGSTLNLHLQNDLDRRFYFEKPAVSKCNLHSRSFAKSLNELCMDSGVSAPPAPPPHHATLPLPAPPATFADLPQEFPLTRSVSTATDIYSSVPPSAQLQRKQQRNMATNTQQMWNKCDEDDDYSEARLCGLKRGIRKTKDELFNEFCKRAGMRAKPKNIYYIPSEDSDEAASSKLPPLSQQIRRTLEDNRERAQNHININSNSNNNNNNNNNDEDDLDGDDHGFRQFRSPPGVTLDGDHLYIVADPAQLVMPRRSSMCADAHLPPLMPMAMPMPQMSQMPQMRRLNSNLSLHTPQTEIWPWPSQQRLASEHGQSRTLPRCFLRQPAGSQDSLGSLQSNYSASQQRFSQLMQQHQQQLQQQNRYLSTLTLPLPLPLSPLPPQRPSHEEMPSKGPGVQWPAAIPSSPSNYAHGPSSFHPQSLYAPVAISAAADSSSASAPASGPVQPPKFQRAYAFDDVQRRASFAVSDAFDLDELERERRRSHASLFIPQSLSQAQPQSQSQYREHYDVINGTAV
ncbi:hypothetical protein ACLKA7_006130 [Drosophila subpalustris]